MTKVEIKTDWKQGGLIVLGLLGVIGLLGLFTLI